MAQTAWPNAVMIYLRALRVHQWIKNLLLFVPLIAAHRVNEGALLLQCLVGFFCFSGVASAVYLFNDLLDIESDRQHPFKRYRPLAAGQFSLGQAVLLIPILLAVALSIAWWLSKDLVVVLIAYCLLNVAYSIKLKHWPILDVLVLTLFYVGRVLAGAVVTDIQPSFWLLAFSMFLFFSLSLVKRCSTLLALQQHGQEHTGSNSYRVSDFNLLQCAGLASGYLSVLVLALYIHSPEILVLYRYPMAIWLLCLLLLFWVSWIWLQTGRGEVQGDPLVFALKDPTSYGVAVAGSAILWVAT